jgi:hypothetical protein
MKIENNCIYIFDFKIGEIDHDKVSITIFNDYWRSNKFNENQINHINKTIKQLVNNLGYAKIQSLSY